MEEGESYHFFSKDVAVNNEIAGLDGWEALVGYWQGSIEDELRIIYRITPTPGQVYTYTLDQTGAFIAASATRFNNEKGELVFFFSSIDGVHRAKLESDGEHIRGTWKQHGVRFPLDMKRFDDTKIEVPREIRFVIKKEVTGSMKKLLSMEGFWSGYLDDSFDEDEKEPPIPVILQMEKVSSDLVEPKLFLPDDTPLPIAIRSLWISEEGEVKIVVDQPGVNTNAIFEGKLSDNGQTLIGVVQYDDADYTPPLTLTWSAHRPDKASLDVE